MCPCRGLCRRGIKEDFFVDLSGKSSLFRANLGENSGCGHGTSSSNLGEMVEEHDVSRDRGLRNEDSVLFLDGGDETVVKGFVGPKTGEQIRHGLVADLIGRTILEMIFPVVCESGRHRGDSYNL